MKQLLERWNEYIAESSESRPLNEVGMYHKPSDGTFTSRRPGAVKSLTKAGAKRAGIDPKHVERGVVTRNDRIRSKFGANAGAEHSCGRLTIAGEPISPQYKCGDYKKKYAQEGIDLSEYPGLTDDIKVNAASILEALLETKADIEEAKGCNCNQYRKQWIQDTLRTINAFALSQKGDLLPKNESVKEPEKKSHYQGSNIEDDKERKTDKRKAADRRRKMRAQIGMNVEPFNRGEKQLLTPNSLFEEPSSKPENDIGKQRCPGAKNIFSKNHRVEE